MEPFLHEYYDSIGYYLYAFGVTVTIGIPLLIIVFYKLYTDHAAHEDAQKAEEEKMDQFIEAKHGLTAQLQLKMNSMHVQHEDRIREKEYSMRQTWLKNKEETRKLNEKIYSLLCDITEKDEDLKRLNEQTICRKQDPEASSCT